MFVPSHDSESRSLCHKRDFVCACVHRRRLSEVADLFYAFAHTDLAGASKLTTRRDVLGPISLNLASELLPEIATYVGKANLLSTQVLYDMSQLHCLTGPLAYLRAFLCLTGLPTLCG